MTRILVAESNGMSREAIAILEHAGEVTLADLDRAELLARVGDADVLWVRLRTMIDAEVFAQAGALRMIATATTGLDHVDLETALSRGIEVVSLRGATEFLRDVRATAELTIGLMLSLLRSIPSAVTDVREGRWNRERFKGRELRGSRVGIVGYGRLGRLVAGYLRSFGATLIASDPNVDSEEIRTVSLDELLATSDVITIHAPLSPETRHLIGREQLARCKPSALLVNTARGDIVDSDALLEALRENRIAGAALDVITDESSAGVAHLPLVEYARNNANLIITPHIGGCTHESMAMTEVYIATEIVRRLKEARV